MEKEFATFAGGCFWFMVASFEAMPGVESVTAGFTGGEQENPSYEQVCMGETNHVEAMQISFQPSICSYEKLLDKFWREIDPTDDGGQFADRGDTYKSAIFYHNETQKLKAEQSKKALQESKVFSKPVVTGILPALPFYSAEEYHQHYHKKNPDFYHQYREESGRDAFIEKTWGSNKK